MEGKALHVHYFFKYFPSDFPYHVEIFYQKTDATDATLPETVSFHHVLKDETKYFEHFESHLIFWDYSYFRLETDVFVYMLT